MKQVLRFQSEQEFQSFFGQLSSAELPNFQAVEGSGGDSGFDGISGTTAFQVYCPEEKNRTIKKIIQKIDTDLEKLAKAKQKLGLEITDWVLVFPEDLKIEAIAHLQKKSRETKMKCSYWGATKLTELVTKYPHIQDSFPTIFLPPVREKVEDIRESLASSQRPKVLSTVDIIGDREYEAKRKAIQEEYKNRIESFVMAHGTNSSAHLVADRAFKKEADDKLKELQLKKEKSDKACQLELDEIRDYYETETEKINEEMSRRGLFSSGIRDKALGRLEIQKQRALERVRLKYAKESVIEE